MPDEPVPAWIDTWVSGIIEFSDLQESHRQALDLIDDLLADPFVRYGGAVKRLSEWEEDWYALCAPLARAFGFPGNLPQSLQRIRAEVERERAAQAVHIPETRGGVDISQERGP